MGAIALTFAVAVVPLTDGKVIVAASPTVTVAMSASATFAVTVMAVTSAMVANVEAVPPMATTSPVIGAVSVASARFDFAVATASDAVLTVDCAELTCCFAELTCWSLPLPAAWAATACS